jgi:hypothetical protein
MRFLPFFYTTVLLTFAGVGSYQLLTRTFVGWAEFATTTAAFYIFIALVLLIVTAPIAWLIKMLAD